MKVIRWARFDWEVELQACRGEVAALSAGWMPHFQRAHYEGEWTVLPLRSIGGRAESVLPEELGDGVLGFAATPLLVRCPAIGRFLGRLECPVRSARLLKLQAGAVIRTHRDVELAFESGVARIHVPVFTNTAVEFVIDEERVAMEAGSCWYINANLPHRVTNGGNTDRIHLVVDCEVNEWLRARLAEAAAVYSTIRREAGELRQMIELLRAMGTPAARELVLSLEQELAATG